MATFMARWNIELPGQSGHIHLSPICTKTGKNLFYDKKADNNMSELMEHFIAGMVKYMKEFLPLTTPTINSYTRLVKGFWAPTAATWGIENRTCSLRAYDVQDDLPKELQLPTSLKESTINLKNSKAARKVFGEKFVEHFVKTREWEVSQYEKAITDWQLERYFEII